MCEGETTCCCVGNALREHDLLGLVLVLVLGSGLESGSGLELGCVGNAFQKYDILGLWLGLVLGLGIGLRLGLVLVLGLGLGLVMHFRNMTLATGTYGLRRRNVSDIGPDENCQ